MMDTAPNGTGYTTPLGHNLGLLPLVTKLELNLPSQRATREKNARNATRAGWAAIPIEDAKPGLSIGDQTILLGPITR
jgi:hypothetical protein